MRVCNICNNVGECLNDPTHPKYKESNSDIYDCCDYVDKKEGKPAGNWMKNWKNNMNKKENKQTSGFAEWAKKTSKKR